MDKETKKRNKYIEAPKEIENMSENTDIDKKIKKYNEIIKAGKTILEIIKDTEDKKDKKDDKKIEEISGNTKVIKKLFFLENFRRYIEMYKEDKSLEGK